VKLIGYQINQQKHLKVPQRKQVFCISHIKPSSYSLKERMEIFLKVFFYSAFQLLWILSPSIVRNL